MARDFDNLYLPLCLKDPTFCICCSLSILTINDIKTRYLNMFAFPFRGHKGERPTFVCMVCRDQYDSQRGQRGLKSVFKLSVFGILVEHVS